MRNVREIENHGIAIRSVDEYNTARMFLSEGGVVSLSCRVNVPFTLNMTQDESDIYKVASSGTYVDFNGRVGGNNNQEWNQLMERLQSIREHIARLMQLSEDIKILNAAKPKGGTA